MSEANSRFRGITMAVSEANLPVTWQQLDLDWQAFLTTQRWDQLTWMADNMRLPGTRLQQHRVLQEMARRYMNAVGFPPSIWPGG